MCLVVQDEAEIQENGRWMIGETRKLNVDVDMLWSEDEVSVRSEALRIFHPIRAGKTEAYGMRFCQSQR